MDRYPTSGLNSRQKLIAHFNANTGTSTRSVYTSSNPSRFFGDVSPENRYVIGYLPIVA